MWGLAKQTGVPSDYTRYAVLGDDILIAYESFAKVYKLALPDLGVTISTQK